RMDYRDLGRAGIKVSPICLGNMNFGAPTCDEQASRAIMHRAIDAGINFFDTANVYQKNESEKLLGRWLAEGGAVRRDPLVIATKVYGKQGESINDRGLSRRHILSPCDVSLTRLSSDCIRLYKDYHLENPLIKATIRS